MDSHGNAYVETNSVWNPSLPQLSPLQQGWLVDHRV